MGDVIQLTVVFVEERETKNTIRFEEVVAGTLETPKIGTMYIPKGTLGMLGWTRGQSLTLKITPGV